MKPRSSAAELAQRFSLLPLVADILQARMVEWPDASLAAVEKFLKPSLQDLPDPFLLKDMDRAANRVVDAILQQQQIAVYGDYDVDGTCAAAILCRFFRTLGMEPVVYQPDRVREGYGLNTEAIAALAHQGVHLLITVDCGISNAREVAEAKHLGVDVIVCDHHHVPPAMPEAVAVLNHKRLDDESPIKTLCGAGMSFYLAMAVRSRLRERNFFAEKKIPEPDIREYLDLVAVASVADMVPLLAETRILTSAGLRKLRTKPQVGLTALLAVAGVDPIDVDTYHLGFVLGPRINASGRLESAAFALELLCTDDLQEAERLAKKLDDLNRERIQITQEMTQEASAMARVELEQANGKLAAIVLSADHWHEGVLGIVASRLVDEFKVPALLVTFNTHVGNGKGSARSGDRAHVTEALAASAPLLEKFGGHRAAAGLSVSRQNFLALKEAFQQSIRKQVEESGASNDDLWKFDQTVSDQTAISERLVQELRILAPFGMGNPEPVLRGSGFIISSTKIMKERHMKVFFTGGLSGFWPNARVNGDYSSTKSRDVLFSPQISNFRGKKSLELRIRDVQQ